MKKRNIIILIAVVAVAVSGLSTWIFFGKSDPAATVTESLSETAGSDKVPGGSDVHVSSGGAVNEIAPRTTSEERYAVVFYNASGVPIEQSVVGGGGDAELPGEPETAIENGGVFLGWDKDFTYIFGDTDIAPNVLDISAYKNALYYHTQYVKKGEQSRVTLHLGGIVEISAFQILIKYDASQLKFTGAENTDPAVLLNSGPDAQIRLAFMTPENTTGDVVLADLVFEVVGEPGQVSELNITVEKAAKAGAEGEDDIVTADYMVKGGKIYIYK